jgi:hypothetical protein
VFCADSEYKWNLIFLSEEKIIARSYNPNDRWPAYIESVNAAARAGRPTAVVIPRPDDAGRNKLIDGLRSGPHGAEVSIADVVLIFYDVPGAVLFRYFPEERPNDSLIRYSQP